LCCHRSIGARIAARSRPVRSLLRCGWRLHATHRRSGQMCPPAVLNSAPKHRFTPGW
jgi:hypothetical protein